MEWERFAPNYDDKSSDGKGSDDKSSDGSDTDRDTISGGDKTKIKYDVGTFALYLKSYFLDHVQKLKDVSLDLSHSEHLDGAALLEGLGHWYKNAGYEIDFRTLNGTLVYVIFLGESPQTKKFRVTELLALVDRRNSLALLDYWMGQPNERLWSVYFNAVDNGVYWDLAILQPIVFDMYCIESYECTEEDYEEAFKDYVESMVFPAGLVFFNKKYRSDLIFPKVAEVLWKMTERTAMEDLGPDEKNALRYFTEERGLPAELAFQVMPYLPNTALGHVDNVILDAGKETWMALDHQLWVLMGPDCVESMKSYTHFLPLARISQHLRERGASPPQSMKQYKAAVTGILSGRLRMNRNDWPFAEPRLRECLGVEVFWRLLAFLEDNSQYGGLFGYMIQWIDDPRKTKRIKELVSARFRMLIQDTMDDPDHEGRYEKLNPIAARIVANELGKEHLYFGDRFAQVRERCRRVLHSVFEYPYDVRRSLEEYILSLPTEAGESSDLYDLQVALVVKTVYNFYDESEEDLQVLEATMGKYSNRQLGNIYKSDYEVYYFFRHSQLREFDPDFFTFERPVDGAQTFALLSRIYQQAHPDRVTIFGLGLGSLGTGLRVERPFARFATVIPLALGNMSRDPDFLEADGGSWLE